MAQTLGSVSMCLLLIINTLLHYIKCESGEFICKIMCVCVCVSLSLWQSEYKLQSPTCYHYWMFVVVECVCFSLYKFQPTRNSS
jgi:hypothetical protein